MRAAKRCSPLAPIHVLQVNQHLVVVGDDRIAVVAPYVGELWVFETGVDMDG